MSTQVHASGVWTLLATVFVTGCGEQTAFQDTTATRTVPRESQNVTIAGADGIDAAADGGAADGGAADGAADGDASDGAADGEIITLYPTPTPVPVDPGFANPGTETTIIEELRRLPKFGMLVNDLQCGLCHVTVLGDVASSRDVPEPRHDSHTDVIGRWLAAEDFAAGPWVSASGGIHDHYRGPELPRDVNQDGHPDFPALNVTVVAPAMRGSVHTTAAYATTIDKVNTGNVVLIGTLEAPIVLSSDVYIDGDLIIKGYYTGNGTLYVSGNIYVPADLRAVRSAFPYSDDAAEAAAQGMAHVLARDTDSLGLATNKSMFIADLESHSPGCCGSETIYTHPTVPANRQAAALGVFAVYNWLPGGKTAYDALYENGVDCHSGMKTVAASFNMIEAFVYAGNTVAGIARSGSFTIRGGLIADFMHVLSGAMNCPTTTSVVHGRPQNSSYIEYDHRLATGLLKMMEHIAQFFPVAP